MFIRRHHVSVGPLHLKDRPGPVHLTFHFRTESPDRLHPSAKLGSEDVPFEGHNCPEEGWLCVIINATNQFCRDNELPIVQAVAWPDGPIAILHNRPLLA